MPSRDAEKGHRAAGQSPAALPRPLLTLWSEPNYACVSGDMSTVLTQHRLLWQKTTVTAKTKIKYENTKGKSSTGKRF